MHSSSVRTEILATAPFPSRTALDERFAVHRLYEAADADAFLRAVGPRVRGVAFGGRLRVDDAFMDRLPALEIVANFGVGYDRVDAAAAARRGVMVTNTPDVLTEEVADLTIGLLVATVRRLPEADRFVRAGLWEKGPFPLTGSLRGRTVGIVGLGRIGRAVAARCAAFGLPVAYYSRRPKPDVAWRHYATVEALAAAVDILVVTAAGGPATEGLVGAAALSALGSGGVLVNVARGSVVDETALIDALETRRIDSAGLDVFPDEPHVSERLCVLDNVVLLPHVGSATVPTREAMGELVVQNLVSWFDTGRALTPVEECAGIGAPYG